MSDGYVLVWEPHLRIVLQTARLGNRRPTDLDVAYPADLPGALKRWKEKQFAIDHIDESPMDAMHGEAIREDRQRKSQHERDRAEYERLREKFEGQETS